jgi:hypothetical protein
VLFSLSFFFVQVTSRLQEPGVKLNLNNDALQVLEDLTWLGTLVTSPCSRINSLLLKLAYNGSPLKFSSKEGWDYVDEKEKVGKLHTR